MGYELSDEDVAEVSATSFPRTDKVRIRMSVALTDEDGDRYVTIDDSEEIISIQTGSRHPIVWITEKR